MIGDVLLECELDAGEPRTLAGFENHAGRTLPRRGRGAARSRGLRLREQRQGRIRGLPRRPARSARTSTARFCPETRGSPTGSSPAPSRTAARRAAGARSVGRRARGRGESRRPPSGRGAAAGASRPSGLAAPAGGRLGGPVGAVVAAVAPAPVTRAVDEHAAAGRGGAEPEAAPAALLDHTQERDARASGELIHQRPPSDAVAKGPAAVLRRQLRNCAGLARQGVQLFDRRGFVGRCERGPGGGRASREAAPGRRPWPAPPRRPARTPAG